MQTYREFQPTCFDCRGLALPEQQDWFVLLSQNRDSDCLERSNFTCALESLGGESGTVNVHRFGHWACGWFEIIIVAPDSEAATIAAEIEIALSNYPVLNDDHLSDLEFTEAADYWAGMSIRERADYLARADMSIFAARRDYLPADDSGRLLDMLRG